MPSVGMRRSTRVFVPKSVVKDADEARVLRSGKRLWSDSAGEKGKGLGGDSWYRLIDRSGNADDVICGKNDGCHNASAGEEVDVKHLNGEIAPGSLSNGPEVSMIDESVHKMYGMVYHRKRKRLESNQSSASSLTSGGGGRDHEDRMCGIPFVRKQRKKRPTRSFFTVLSEERRVVERNKERQVLPGNQQDSLLNRYSCQAMVLVVTEPTVSNTSGFVCLLYSILCYMMRSMARWSELSAFLCTKPIALAFSRNSIQLLRDNQCGDTGENNRASSGICKIFESPSFTPLFSMDFLSVPSTFVYLHSRMLIGSSYLPNVMRQYLMALITKERRFRDSQSCLLSISMEFGLSGSEIMTSADIYTGNKELGIVVKSPKSRGRRSSRRHALSPRGTQKKSRMGSARGTSLLVTESQRPFSVVDDDLLSSIDGSRSFHLRPSNRKQRSHTRKSFGEYEEGDKSTLVESRQNLDSSSCVANILVIESDKCYREEGADVTLEYSPSNEWLIAVRRHGSLRHCHKAQNMMPSSTTNRFNHAIIWGGGNGWKLEFLERREWFIYKQLHKACYDRNMISSKQIIHVPGLQEVPENGEKNYIPFVRPERYITMKEDEVARVLMKTTANYDIQSDDEEFLSNLNNEFSGEANDESGCISIDNFEKIIDVFEKTAYCSPDDITNENEAANSCLNLGKREMVVGIYNYWVKKRKQKRSALLRVFQCHPPRGALPSQKPFLRKKRSVKRKGRQYGIERANQPRPLRDEHDIEEARRKFEEAKNNERRLLEVAISKRQRAQILMDNVDLATYKATIAVMLAEAAETSGLPNDDPNDDDVNFFIG